MPDLSNRYHLGCAAIDRDLELLWAIVEQLSTAANEGVDRRLKSVYMALRAYLKAHFENEETLMESAAYPSASEHKIEHQELLNQLHSLGTVIHRGCGEAARHGVRMLESWLLWHVDATDRRLAESLDPAGFGVDPAVRQAFRHDQDGGCLQPVGKVPLSCGR